MKSTRLFILLCCLWVLTCFGQANGEGLLREYLASYPQLCPEHADNGSLNMAFDREDDNSDTLLASLGFDAFSVLPEPTEQTHHALSPFKDDKTLLAPHLPCSWYQQYNRVHSNYCLQRGIVFGDQLQYAEAITAFSEALNIDPSNDKVYLERAGAYWETDQIELALEDYEQWFHLQSLNLTKLQSLSLTQADIECAGGLVVGTTKGAAVGAAEFVPSTLRSLRGLGMGLWVLAKNPATVSQEFINDMYDLVGFLRYQASKELLLNIVPELRQLIDAWQQLGVRATTYVRDNLVTRRSSIAARSLVWP